MRTASRSPEPAVRPAMARAGFTIPEGIGEDSGEEGADGEPEARHSR